MNIDERLLVFFAGHGHTIKGYRAETGFLVPYDADPSDLSTLIRWDELTRYSDLIPSKHILFIMDACYGGLMLTRHLKSGSTRFLKDMMLRRSRQVLTAGKANEVVADSGGPIPNHSVFTGHLIEGLRGGAPLANGIITANGLMAYVYGKVAHDQNSNQTPHYGHFDGDGDFIIRAPGITEPEKPESKDIDLLIEVPYPDELAHHETTEGKTRRVKSLLSTDSTSIELHDFLIAEVRQFLAETSGDNFSAKEPYSKEEFLRRLAQYEEISTNLAVLLACISYWSKPIHQVTLQKVLARSADRLEYHFGQTTWQALQWYPLLLEIYYSGIAAIDGKRFDSLATIFYAPIPSTGRQDQPETFAEGVARVFHASTDDFFKQIPGHERHYVPLSEYLFKILQPRLDDTLFLGQNYEQAFDTFEVFFALAVADIYLLKNDRSWGPIGRFGWKHKNNRNSPLTRIIDQGRAQQGSWAPLAAGLFGGNYDRFNNAAKTFEELISQLHWG